MAQNHAISLQDLPENSEEALSNTEFSVISGDIILFYCTLDFISQIVGGC